MLRVPTVVNANFLSFSLDTVTNGSPVIHRRGRTRAHRLCTRPPFAANSRIRRRRDARYAGEHNNIRRHESPSAAKAATLALNGDGAPTDAYDGDLGFHPSAGTPNGRHRPRGNQNRTASTTKQVRHLSQSRNKRGRPTSTQQARLPRAHPRPSQRKRQRPCLSLRRSQPRKARPSRPRRSRRSERPATSTPQERPVFISLMFAVLNLPRHQQQPPSLAKADLDPGRPRRHRPPATRLPVSPPWAGPTGPGREYRRRPYGRIRHALGSRTRQKRNTRRCRNGVAIPLAGMRVTRWSWRRAIRIRASAP